MTVEARGVGPAGPAGPAFERVIASPIPRPPPPPARSLAELLFADRPPAAATVRDDAPIVQGTVGAAPLSVTLRQLRHAALELDAALEDRGVRAGDTVALVRLPRTSEALCAVAYAALSARGCRVLLPMYLEPERFRVWLRRSDARAILWSASEVREARDHEADRHLLSALEATADELGVPALCLDRDLALPARLAVARAASPPLDEPRLAARLAAARPDDECLVLTTSGTTGQARLVVYRQEALLRSCQAWEAAGLFAPDRQGGRGLCLLFAHSMGVRAFWNAVWTRQALCLVPPEWFLEAPERARALLLGMRPEHVTGGPATFRVLLELARVFPELKDGCLRSLRCAVSTGAPFDPELARRLEVAIGLAPANAFGTTETMQACSTLLAEEGGPPGTLGPPLPGVRLGLERAPDAPALHRLWVSTPFGCAAFLDEDPTGAPIVTPAPAWWPTGDLVEAAGERVAFVAREREDFVKDGFGVKVPLARVATFYRELGAPIDHVELLPLREEPGLAALVFLGDAGKTAAPGASPPPLVSRREILDRVRSRLEARHEELRGSLEDFELRHFTIDRFACVEAAAPRTAKGTPDAGAIRRLPHLGLLTGRFVDAPTLARLDPERLGRSSYERLASPRRGELLRLLRLDRRYVRGRGDRLTYAEGGAEAEVIDLVGGFGATLLGHRHPRVVAAAAAFAAGEEVFLADQGSSRDAEGELARRLALLVGRATGRGYVVRLASTGAEAVELALAHAVLEREERLRKLTRDLRREFGAECPERVAELEARNAAALAGHRPRVLALAGSYHGLTAAARGAIGNAEKRRPFQGLLGVEAIFLPLDGEVDLEALLAAEVLPIATLRREGRGVVEAPAPFSRVVAAIAEPVQGEGGVREVPARLLARLAGRDFPLILDEIQAGLGRTGELLASRGVVGDVYLFSKALGGAVAKIAAVLIDRTRYVARFDELFSSTFAGDAYSCRVATAVLDVIEDDDVPGRARARGAALRRALEAVREAYPDVLAAIRGRGLLVGVELDPGAAAGSFVLRAAVDHERLGLLAAAYLLDRHRLRLLPTLSAPLVLRVEPSVYLDDDAIARLAAGLRALCAAVRAGDTAELLGFLVDRERAWAYPEDPAAAPVPAMPVALEAPRPGARRVAFLNHFVYPERELAMVDPSLRALGPTARRALLHRLARLLELRPLRTSAQHLLEGRVHLLTLTLAVDAATLEELHRAGCRAEIAERVGEAVELAARHGCEAIALGAYTSILTRDGTALRPPPGLRVVSGNSLTVAIGARRLLGACAAAGIRPGDPAARLAVVGAAGNIGAGLAERLLARGPFRTAILVGRGRPALERLRARLLERRPELELELATDLDALVGARAIAIATAAAEPLVYPHHLSSAPVVVVDVAIPGALAEEARRLPRVTLVPLSGTVPVPGEPGFVASSHTALGTTFACAAEVLLCGLEPEATRALRLVGRIDGRAVDALEELAVRHGFLAPSEGGAP